MGPGIWIFIRVLLWIIGGGFGGAHMVISRDPALLKAAESTWIGSNLFGIFCLCLTLAWVIGFFLPKDLAVATNTRANFVWFLQQIRKPFVWIASCWKSAKEAESIEPVVNP